MKYFTAFKIWLQFRIWNLLKVKKDSIRINDYKVKINLKKNLYRVGKIKFQYKPGIRDILYYCF